MSHQKQINYKQYAKHLNMKEYYKFIKKIMHFPHAPLSEGHKNLHKNKKNQRDIKQGSNNKVLAYM